MPVPACPKSSEVSIFFTNLLLVFVVFAAVDYVVYMLLFPGMNPYDHDLLNKGLYTLFLAAAFAHGYNRASITWAPYSHMKFINSKATPNPADDCKCTGNKLLNGFVFSVVFSVVVLMFIAVSGVFISFIFYDLLHAVHGTPETRDVVDATGKLIIAGAVLEAGGKTESDPRMK